MDNVNITVNETTENIVINPSILTDVIDVNLYATTETVDISVTPNLTTININTVTGGGLVTSVNGQIGDVIVSIPTVNDATTTVKGIIKLAGDLAGTADLPTVPNKVDKIAGKDLSTNDFTNTLKTKLDGIADGAEVNVNADWNATSGDAQILNKPTIPAAQIQSDWTQSNNVALDYIKNKPTVPTAITKTSQLINDGDDGNTHFISLEDLPSNLTLYATNAASDVSTYYKLVTSITDTSYNTIAVNIPTGTITTTSQFIASLITNPNVIVGNPGIFNITTIGNIQKLSGTGNAEFYFQVYKRTTAGVETLITLSGATLPVLNSGYAEFSANALWNDGTFLSTDRIVLKYYANRIPNGSNPTYQFQFGGISPVRSLVPIPLNVVPYGFENRHHYNNPISYCGTAPTGSLESSPVWTIAVINVNPDGTTSTTYLTNVTWTSIL